MFEFNHKVQETGRIPRPVARDNLVGSSSAFCVCVCAVHTYGALAQVHGN